MLFAPTGPELRIRKGASAVIEDVYIPRGFGRARLGRVPAGALM